MGVCVCVCMYVYVSNTRCTYLSQFVFKDTTVIMPCCVECNVLYCMMRPHAKADMAALVDIRNRTKSILRRNLI